MKNRASIEEIVDKTSAIFGRKEMFDEYESLLLKCGLEKDDIMYFFVYPEG
jgi:hypothetical protein